MARKIGVVIQTEWSSCPPTVRQTGRLGDAGLKIHLSMLSPEISKTCFGMFLGNITWNSGACRENAAGPILDQFSRKAFVLMHVRFQGKRCAPGQSDGECLGLREIRAETGYSRITDHVFHFDFGLRAPVGSRPECFAGRCSARARPEMRHRHHEQRGFSSAPSISVWPKWRLRVIA